MVTGCEEVTGNEDERGGWEGGGGVLSKNRFLL